ncbi:MAG: PKD domain-containing protein, partial [Thermoplasmata archaeon]|nr:PKD domain-containing protein [Thermoplasmata archaeon]
GGVGYGRNTTHLYTSTGQKMVSLFLSDGSNEGEVYIIIDIPENAFPDARIAGPSVAMLGEVLTFTGAGSADHEGQPIFFNWTYGDELESTSDNISITIAYDTTGTKRIELNIFDSANGQDSEIHYVEIYKTDLFYPSEVNADSGELYLDFDCIEGPREKDLLVDYVDDDGIGKTASYLGYRSYKLLVPEGKDCFVEVDVLEGGPVDLLLLETGEYSRFKNGESQLLIKDYGTAIETYYISFEVQQKGTLYLVVSNDGRFVDGHEPLGGARYRITIRYPDEEAGSVSEYVDETEDEGGISFFMSCCFVLILFGLIIIAGYIVSRKAEAVRAGKKTKPSLKGEEVADRGPKPGEVRIDPYKKVYGGKVARDDLKRQPNWKKLDDKFSLTRMEREIGKKDVEKPQFLKAEQPHWEAPRELEEAEVDPMMEMGGEVKIPIDVIKGPRGGASPSGGEEELLDIETIRRMLEERKRGTVGGDGARSVLPPPPEER